MYSQASNVIDRSYLPRQLRQVFIGGYQWITAAENHFLYTRV